MFTSHMYDWCMSVDFEKEVIAALKSPGGQEAIADVFETVLERRGLLAGAPEVGSEEAARMLGIKSENKQKRIRALHARLLRDDDLRKLKKRRGRWVVFDRAELLEFIRQRARTP